MPIPFVNGRIVRTLTFKTPAKEDLLLELTDEEGGTIIFRTAGRNPVRWSITLQDLFTSLSATTMDETPAPAGKVALKLQKGGACGMISLEELEQDLSIAHPDDVPDHAKFIKYVYALMREREKRKNKTTD